ncbi:MAG: hypothetical protein LCI00_18445 [Chloroflexi bacterium]|nr:hypothetical protein [Chloroflexota bacterium]MCC6891455.1 hypothetical protein [Anaerolineae bacterium]
MRDSSIKRKPAAAPSASSAASPSGKDSPLPDFELTWECPNCGQRVFGKQPPDICDYCCDLTTWRLVVRPST